MKKRIVCILLAIMLIVMSLPLYVFAAQFPAAQYKSEAQWNLNNGHYLAAAVLFELAAKAYEDEGDIENARLNYLASEAAYLDITDSDPSGGNEGEDIQPLDLDQLKEAFASFESDVLAMAQQGIGKEEFLIAIDAKAGAVIEEFGVVEPSYEILKVLASVLVDMGDALAENEFYYYSENLYISAFTHVAPTNSEFEKYVSILEDAVTQALNVGDWQSAMYFYGAAAMLYETTGDTENAEKYLAKADEIQTEHDTNNVVPAATILSEGNKLVLITIVTAIIFCLAGFLLGRRSKQ